MVSLWFFSPQREDGRRRSSHDAMIQFSQGQRGEDRRRQGDRPVGLRVRAGRWEKVDAEAGRLRSGGWVAGGELARDAVWPPRYMDLHGAGGLAPAQFGGREAHRQEGGRVVGAGGFYIDKKVDVW